MVGDDAGKTQEAQLKAAGTLASRAVPPSSRVQGTSGSRISEGTTPTARDNRTPVLDSVHNTSEDSAPKTREESVTRAMSSLRSPRESNLKIPSGSRLGLQDHHPSSVDMPTSGTKNGSSTQNTSDTKAKGEGPTKGERFHTSERQTSLQLASTEPKPKINSSGKADDDDKAALDKPVLKTKDRISESSR